MLTRLVYFDEIEENRGKTNREKQRLSVSVRGRTSFVFLTEIRQELGPIGSPTQLVLGCDLRSCGMPRSASWQLVADVLEQPYFFTYSMASA